MEFKRYNSAEPFKAAVLPLLLEHETQNNLLISLITSSKAVYARDWLFATVGGSDGVCLTALCVKPFDLLLFETNNTQNDDALELLSKKLRSTDFSAPGVMAESGLARRFSEVFYGAGLYELHMSMVAMRLDRLSDHKKANGTCRSLESRDLYFAPYWERSFSEDCRAKVFSISENADRLRTRLGKNTHYIWEDEDGIPVSQAVHGRDTPNSAVINGVYTPPHYRRRGYGTSVVTELSKTLLDNGRSFCCLFADAENPASRKMYDNLGFYDVCEIDVYKSGQI